MNPRNIFLLLGTETFRNGQEYRITIGSSSNGSVKIRSANTIGLIGEILYVLTGSEENHIFKQCY